MKNYQKGNFRGDRGDKGGRSSFKPSFKSRGEDTGRDSRSREMPSHKAVCSDCSKSCDVPFKPSSDKPVYCRDCFASKRNRETEAYEASKKFGNDASKSKAPFSQPSAKFVPHVVGNDNQKQLSELNARIDKLTESLAKMHEVISEMKAAQVSAPLVAKVTKVVPAKVVVSTPAVKKVAPKVVKKVVPKATAKASQQVRGLTVDKPVIAKKAAPKVTVKAGVTKVAPKKVVAKKTK